MSESNTMAAPRFMREEVRPVFPEALEAAALARIEEGPAALREIRLAALGALRRVGLPTTHSEDFSFIRVGEFLPHLQAHAGLPENRPSSGEIDALAFPESRENLLVLADGAFAPELSRLNSAAAKDGGFRVLPLELALTQDAALGAALLAAASAETDAAAALAMIFSAPLSIELAGHAAAPLQVLHWRSAEGGSPGGALPRRGDAWLVVKAGKLAEGRILLRHESGAAADAQNPGRLWNEHYHLLVDEAASLKFLETEAAAEGRDMHFRKLTARVARNGRLLALAASTGSRLTRNAYAVDLLAEGAEADINGAAVLAANRQAHNFVHVRHAAPHGSSRQHFKTVATDKSRASVDGTITVDLGAQLTNANQLINNLMLSDEARTDSKPRLMIHADDVKCSHGATVGKLDPAQEFYLISRGLSPAQARTLMTVAFIAEIADKAAGEPGFRALVDRGLVDTLKNRLDAGRN